MFCVNVSRYERRRWVLVGKEELSYTFFFDEDEAILEDHSRRGAVAILSAVQQGGENGKRSRPSSYSLTSLALEF